MNKKIVLGCCVCIVLIVIVIILFFKPTSEYNLADISDNLYNIFQTRKKLSPWNIEYQSIDSLFEPRFVNEVKTTIKERIKDNIPKYIDWSLRTPSSTLNLFLSFFILQKGEDWSSENIIKKIKTPIKQDQRFTVCRSEADNPNWAPYCIVRVPTADVLSWADWKSDLSLYPAGYQSLVAGPSPHFFTFTKRKQL